MKEIQHRPVFVHGMKDGHRLDGDTDTFAHTTATLSAMQASPVFARSAIDSVVLRDFGDRFTFEEKGEEKELELIASGGETRTGSGLMIRSLRYDSASDGVQAQAAV